MSNEYQDWLIEEAKEKQLFLLRSRTDKEMEMYACAPYGRIDFIGQNGNNGEHYEAKTRKNGGELSFLESAELWKKVKPRYEVEDKDSWAGKFTERNR